MSEMVERVARAMMADMFAEHELPARLADAELFGKYCRTARAAIAEVQRWRPIAEAPKDGVSFLAASGEWQTVCCWNKYRNDWCAVAPSYPSYVADERPTHWQPLPAPPQ